MGNNLAMYAEHSNDRKEKHSSFILPFYVLVVYIFSLSPNEAKLLLPVDLWSASGNSYKI